LHDRPPGAAVDPERGGWPPEARLYAEEETVVRVKVGVARRQVTAGALV
jgi:hypothetical protein